MYLIIVKFMGLLANVDSSISDVVLDHGYSIRSIKMKDLIEFLNVIEDRREPYYIAEELLKIYPKYRTTEKISRTEDSVLFIENKFKITDKWTRSSKNMVELNEFHTEHYKNYLVNTLNLIRLFKEGNICIPYYFYYYGSFQSPTVIIRPEKIPIHSYQEYSLEKNEFKDLKGLIDTEWHFDKKKFLKNAFESYNLSYEINKIRFQFFILMAGLEALFVESSEEKITKTVSRNTAIVIGNEKTGEDIYENMIRLYKIRSEIAHKGNDEIITSDLLLLRKYLRESIKEMNFIITEETNLHGKNGKITLNRFQDDDEYKKREFKQNISYLLYSCGFGDKPWRK